MFSKLDEWGPITVLAIVVVVIVLVSGGVAVIVNPDKYTFSMYVDDLKGLGVVVGGTAIGRGLLSGLTNHAIASNLGPEPVESDGTAGTSVPHYAQAGRVDVPDAGPNPLDT